MKNIHQQIHYLIDKDIATQKCLKQGIVNVRALARKIITENGLGYSTDAVISALRRYDMDHVSLGDSAEAKKMFGKMAVSIKDGVARIVLREKAFEEICADYVGQKHLKNNLRITRAKETLTLVISEKELEKKLSLFDKSDVLNVTKGLCELRLHFPKEAGEMKGIFACVANELALRDTNIEEMMYSVPDLLIYVKEENVINAHKSLMELKK